jgi:hypothetical protein
MKAFATSLVVSATIAASAASAGNTSSNSSSNSSNGIHTRVDTITRDDGRGRRYYEERIYRGRTDEPRRSRNRARVDFDD